MYTQEHEAGKNDRISSKNLTNICISFAYANHFS